MSTIYTFTCKGCGRQLKRFGYQVYSSDENLCVRCDQDIPFDGEDTSIKLPNGERAESQQSRMGIK